MIKSATRRQILKIGAQASLAVLFPITFAGARDSENFAPRTLSFFNTHTLEALRICYFKDGNYDPKALERINYILRDHRTGEIYPIDTKLLNLLNAVASRTKGTKAFHVISGYRSPATNAMLQKISSGVSSKSLHLVGKAIDIRLPEYSTTTLRDICITLKGGGVGFYSKSDFVHLDTGNIRSWNS